MSARANSASTSPGVEDAKRMIAEQRRSTKEPGRRAAAIPSMSEADQAINNATAAKITVRNKGSRMRLHTGACKTSEWPRSPRAASARSRDGDAVTRPDVGKPVPITLHQRAVQTVDAANLLDRLFRAARVIEHAHRVAPGAREQPKNQDRND